MMQDFEVPEMIEAMGGNSGFEFSPVQYVASIPQAIDGIVSSPVSMVGSATFLEGYSTPGSLSASIATGQTRAGTVYDISVKGFYPKASAAMIFMFYEMARQKFILIVSDISGEKMIYGNKNEPLSFVFSKSSKNVPGERSGYDFEFSGKVTEPVPLYSIVS